MKDTKHKTLIELARLNPETTEEDLIKAMNKEGLVQKEVTVHRKNGTTFTRKQWVKASEIKEPKNPKSKKGGGDDVRDKKKPPHKSEEYGIRWKETDRNDRIVTKEKMFNSEKSRDRFMQKLEQKDNFVNVDSMLNPKKEEPAEDYRFMDSQVDSYSFSTMSDEELKDSGVVRLVRLKGEPNEDGLDHMEIVELDDGGVLAQIANSEGMTTEDVPYEATETLKELIEEFKKQGYKEIVEDKNFEDEKVKTPEFDLDKFNSIKSDRTAALDYLKESGITWKEHEHKGINWMRAMMAAKEQTGISDITAKENKFPKNNKNAPFKNKVSKQDANKQIDALVKEHGRDGLLKLAKEQGITWKEDAHEGINWMRARMSVRKHLESGGSFMNNAGINRANKKKK